MNPNNHLRATAFVCMLCILFAAAGSWAELSEPDHIIYGSASNYGQPLDEGSLVSLVLEGAEIPIARHTVGSDPDLGDFYVLRVPLDAVGGRGNGTARTGDEATILIDGQLAGQIAIGERGSVQVLDVDPENVDATASLAIDDVSAEETDAGTFEMVFTVSLAPSSEDEVTVDWITGDGSAVGGAGCGAGIDFIADSGMVTIAPGDESATITILGCGEADLEADEAFYVDLLDPSNAVLLDPQGRGTIIDDDTPPQLSVNNITVTEPQTGQLSAFFRVSLSRLWGQEVTFGFATSNGSASAGSDYLSTSGTGTIPVGSLETTIEVEILSDTLNEEEETFFVTLSSPVNSSILDGEGQAIIVDAAQFLIWLETQVDGVAAVDGLAGAYDSAVSPDGLHIYVAGSADNAIAVFDRETSTGALTFVRAYTTGDFTGRAIDTFVGLGGPQSVVVSGDGLNVYVAASTDDSVTAFSRDPADGLLTLLEVETNGENDLGDPGDAVVGLEGPTAMALSPSHPDGQHLYVAGYGSGTVAVFARDPADGRLSFLESETDGVDDPSDLGAMVDGLHLASDVVVSADGANVYVAGQGDNAVAVFERDIDPGSGTLGKLSFMEVEKDGIGGVNGLAAATALATTGDGDHLYVAGQSDNAIAVFSRDAAGLLDFVEMVSHGSNGVSGLLGASGVAVSEDDRYVYTCGYLSNAATIFQRDTDGLGGSYGTLEYIEVKTDGVGGVDGLFRPTSITVAPGDGNVYATGYSDNAVAVFRRDLTVPTDPALDSSSHFSGQWSNNPVIEMTWSGATDDGSGSGVAGYSFLFDMTAATIADEATDLTHTVDPHQTSSAVLPDGMDHYFHLRTCDHSDNCSVGLHAGPYWIDTVAPDNVVVTASSHTVGVPTFDDTIQMWWNEPVIDPGTTPSGVYGYSYTFNSDPIGQCNLEVDALVGTSTATSISLQAGLWYFHICAVDNAGNWSVPGTAGPFEVINDSIPPKIIDLSSVSEPEPGRTSMGAVENHGITQFLMVFSKQMFDPTGDSDPNDVSNPANYRLVTAGPDALYQTGSCSAIGGDDIAVAIESVVYNSSTSTAAVFVGGDTAIPLSRYRLFGCATGGLVDINHNALDGDGNGSGGDDYFFTFLLGRTNLLHNPNLDIPSLSPEWTLSNSERISHDADDAGSAETSGSIRIHRDSAVGDDNEFSVSQCVLMPPWDGAEFHLSAVVRVNETLGGDPGFAGAFAGVTYFDAVNCSGMPVGPEHLTDVVLDDTFGAWLPVSSNVGAAPAAARSALVSMAVQIPLAEDFPFDAWFDNILFQVADSLPPDNPIVVSTTHVPGTWTTENDIGMSWSGATDAGVGVAGYSFHFDTMPGIQPDDIIDVEHIGGVFTAGSGALADGKWRFHLSTCDYIGNCSTAVHKGWYGIDTVPPANPTAITSTSHSIGLDSIDSIIEMSWTPAIDNPPVPSGVTGYSYEFSGLASGSCNQVTNLGAGATGVDSVPLPNGSWYFHICTQDGASNWSAVETIGPFTIADNVPPRVTGVSSVTAPNDGSLDQNDATVASITRLLVDFSEPLFDPTGNTDPEDVTNPSNYRVVAAGNNGTIETGNCLTVQGDDQIMAIDSVLFDLDSRQASVSMGTTALPQDRYRFLVCGANAIRDAGGNYLDGDGNGTGGDDFGRDFDVTATNLLANPNFDADLMGWDTIVVPPSDFAHSSDDADLALFSGSAMISNLSGADVEFELTQCVDMAGVDGVMDLSGRIRIAQSGVADPEAWGQVDFYSGPGCGGSFLSAAGTPTVVGDTGGSWVPIQRSLGFVPIGTVSARVTYVAMVGLDSPAEFDADFDSLALRVIQVLFGDGFESGDTTKWSATTP